MVFKCKICTNSFDISNSYSNSGCYCKNCHKLKRKQHYLKNKEKTKIKVKEYQDKNCKIYAKRAKEWQRNNKVRHLEINKKYQTKRRNSDRPLDIQYCLAQTLRSRLRDFLKLKNFRKKYKFSEYIGCTPEELKQHIESQFYGDISWSNHGKLWHFDHIIPLMSAKTEEEIYQLCHYTNLQPLTIEDHKKKTLQDLQKAKG